jgi:hypothetical protein
LPAVFDDGEALLKAARGLGPRGVRVLDAYSPVPVEGLAELLRLTSTRIRLIMFLGGTESIFRTFLWIHAPEDGEWENMASISHMVCDLPQERQMVGTVKHARLES